jgi:hypothetical protein
LTGPAGNVQAISTGTIANSATPGVGTASIGGTAANPSININFPNDVQSVTFNSDNSATAGGGYVSNTGTLTNPVLDVHFPADVQSVTVGTVSNTASAGAGTFSIDNSTPTQPKININFPASSGGGATGASPSGIPYTVAGHSISSITYYSPTGNQQGSLSVLGTAIAPTACTPSMTIYSYVPLDETWTLGSVTPISSTSTWNTPAPTPLVSCNTTAASGSTPHTCSVTASSTVSAGTIMTIYGSTALSTGFAGLEIAFSCQ